MPEASNVYRKIDVGMGSTPSGSYILVPNIFYKHINPLGFKKQLLFNKCLIQ